MPQIHFPINDVEKNFRHFMQSVKEATGNIKDSKKQGDVKKGTLFYITYAAALA
jgi:hypothetical protein